ncbi:DUF3021 domain-containing protein [Siminovitchia terrae]|uniref:DUF3021 domain-containing protein n=2 Tax=Siminovitchia terrae TaxID=1914933 RepID=A0A429XAL8_SIMTE|nr:DUF3021 domain-containing protein [Siminovitchia terrae]
MIMLVFKAIRNILIGFGIANLSLLIFILIAGFNGWTQMDMGLLRTQVIGSMAYGAFCGIVSLVFESERLSVFTKTSIQFFGFVTGYGIFGYSLGWFHSLENMLLMYTIYIAIYMIIWLCIYFFQKRLADELNKGIR